MIRFVHTADLQLGMPFHQVPGDRGADLRNRRFEVIDRLVALASEQDAAFIVVAGDVFDANTVDDRAIVQACARFGRARVPVIAIPGNHDHGGPGSVWTRRAFRENRPENLHTLVDTTPIPVAGGRAVILPAPLAHRHTRGDATEHLTPTLGREVAPGAARIGLAHGTVRDFTGGPREEATNFIDPGCAIRADLDYLALGDWHGCKEVSRRVWYSGTPEPTSFKDNDAGKALVVQVARGAAPLVTPVPIASTRWIRHEAELHDEEDISRLGRWFDGLDAPLDTLVRLELRGGLSFTALEALEAQLRRMEGQLLYLRRKEAGLIPCGDDTELAAIASHGFVSDAIDLLRARAAAPDGEVAARALRLLYRLHRLAHAAPGATPSSGRDQGAAA